MYQSLGCPHGCRDGIKGAQGDDVRAQSRSFLQRLSNLDKTQFSRYIQRSFLAQSLQSVMDQLHALIGFCAEPFILQSGTVSLASFYCIRHFYPATWPNVMHRVTKCHGLAMSIQYIGLLR